MKDAQMLSGKPGRHADLTSFRAANLGHEYTPVGRFLVCSIFWGENSSLPKRGALNQIAAVRLIWELHDSLRSRFLREGGRRIRAARLVTIAVGLPSCYTRTRSKYSSYKGYRFPCHTLPNTMS